MVCNLTAKILCLFNANTHFKHHTQYNINYAILFLYFQSNGRVAVQKDTDSSCSNDSGRGLSEEGENSMMAVQPSPNMCAHTPSKRQSQPCTYSKGFTTAHPLATHPRTPQNNYTPCPPYLKARGQPVVTTAKPAVPVPFPEYQAYQQNQPLDVQRLSSEMRQDNYRCNPSLPINKDMRLINNSHYNHGYHANNQSRESVPSIYTRHEEMYGDNTSTTSGSYFVNLNDFDDEVVPSCSVEV